jgi:hypothetical protein
MSINDNLFEASATTGLYADLVFSQAITRDLGLFKSGDVVASASVDGAGTITFGESDFNFAVVWTDGTETIFDLNGVTLSNIPYEPIIPDETDEPDEIIEQPAHETNPDTGVLPIKIPLIVSSVIIITTSGKRRKSA